MVIPLRWVSVRSRPTSRELTMESAGDQVGANLKFVVENRIRAIVVTPNQREPVIAGNPWRKKGNKMSPPREPPRPVGESGDREPMLQVLHHALVATGIKF